MFQIALYNISKNFGNKSSLIFFFQSWIIDSKFHHKRGFEKLHCELCEDFIRCMIEFSLNNTRQKCDQCFGKIHHNTYTKYLNCHFLSTRIDKYLKMHTAPVMITQAYWFAPYTS